MKIYIITLTLSSGNKVNARIAAENYTDAMTRLMQSKDYLNFVENDEIGSMDFEIEKMLRPPAVNPKNYKIEKLLNHHWRCTDIQHGICVVWKEGDYNDSVTTKYNADNCAESPIAVATAMREIGEYLFQYHKNLLKKTDRNIFFLSVFYLYLPHNTITKQSYYERHV